MAKKEYTYGDQATVIVAKPGYKSQTKTYTMTGDVTDDVVLEEITDITLTIRVLNALTSRPLITVTGGNSSLYAFIRNGSYYECEIKMDIGQTISYVISATGYRNYLGLYTAGTVDEITPITLTENSVIPTGYTLTWQSRNQLVLNFTITAYKNEQAFALTAQSNARGAATLDGFDRGDTVSWSARSISPAATDSGSLTVGGGITIDIF